MSSPPFEPQNLIKRLQGDEWADNPEYQAAYQAILLEQSPLTQLTEKLRISKWLDTPEGQRKKLATQSKVVIELKQDYDDAFYNMDKESGMRFWNAIKRGRQKEQPPWHLTTLALALLSIIYARKVCGLDTITVDELQDLVVRWQRANKQRKTFDTSQWNDVIKWPEFLRLFNATFGDKPTPP